MSDPCVLSVDRGAVAVLILNRPERRNALSRRLIDALSDTLSRVATESAIRAVVVTGSGPTFCAGMDLKEAAEGGGTIDSERIAVADVQAIADLVSQVHQFPKPTIAALNGDAFGGGAGLASACDFVIAESQARIGYPEVLRGLVAAVVVHDLVRQVGDRRARSLLLTGEALTAIEAERWGLINHVVATGTGLDRAVAFGESLAAGGPIALATTKRLLDEATARPVDLRGAAAVSAAIRVSDEAEEGIRAFLQKRPPAWAAKPASDRN